MCASLLKQQSKCEPEILHADIWTMQNIFAIKTFNIVLCLPNLLAIIDMDEVEENIKLWLQHWASNPAVAKTSFYG